MKLFRCKTAVSCLLSLAMLIGVTTDSACAATKGQNSLKNIGVNITWYDFGKQFTDYSITDDLESGFYMISASSGTDYKAGFVNGKGEVTLTPDRYEINSFGNEPKPTFFAVKDGSCKVIDPSGIKSLDTNAYSKVEPFYDYGYATVTLKAGSKKGLMDQSGVLLFIDEAGKYEQFSYVADGLFSARMGNGIYDLVNSKGVALNQTPYAEITRAEEGMIQVMSSAKKYGFLNLEGKETVPTLYDNTYSFSNGLAPVSRDGKWGFVDISGNEVIPCKYDGVYNFNDGLAPVSSGDKWGLMDREENLVLPMEYDESPYFQNGFFTVPKDGKTVVLDCATRSKTVKDYSFIRMESPDLVYVEKVMNGSKVSAYLDKEEKNLTGFKEFSPMYLSPQFYLGNKPGDYPPGVVPPHDYSRRLALLDSNGNNLTGFQYQSARYTPFDGFQVMGKHYYGGETLVNQNGAEVLPPVFEHILVTDEGYVFVTIRDPETGMNGRVGYFKIPQRFYTANNTRPLTVYLNGTELYFALPPVIMNEETMIPMRKVFESLGADVKWDNSTKTVTAVSGSNTISLTVDEKTASVNGTLLELKTAPFLNGDTMFVPLRLVSESLGADVSWDGALRRVIIDTAVRDGNQ